LKDAAPIGGLVPDSAMAGRPDFEKLELKAQSGEIGKLLGKIRGLLPKKLERVVD
jgi:hypothetical protein